MNNNTQEHLPVLAEKAQAALAMSQQGREGTIQGWIDFGRAVNSARAHFSPCDKGYEAHRKWAKSFRVPVRKCPEIESTEFSSAIWAASNPDQFEHALSLSRAHTVRGVYLKWLDEQRRETKQLIEAGYGPPDVTQADQLHKVFTYCPDRGKLFWRERLPHYYTDQPDLAVTLCIAFNRKRVGQEALNQKSSTGYMAGKVFGKHLLAHRVLYAIHHGEWPLYIDHINGNRMDNRMANLRSVTMDENNRNVSLRSSNTSGISGVQWCKKSKKWRGIIKINKRAIHIGLFESIDEARPIMAAAREKYGFHENHGMRR